MEWVDTTWTMKAAIHHVLIGAGSILAPDTKAAQVPAPRTDVGVYFDSVGSYMRVAISKAGENGHVITGETPAKQSTRK